jgi:hypothetical protein
MFVFLQFNAYLHSILKLGNQWVVGDELKEATLDLEGHGHDEGAEKEHLEDEKSEDLVEKSQYVILGASHGVRCGPVRRSNS